MNSVGVRGGVLIVVGLLTLVGVGLYSLLDAAAAGFFLFALVLVTGLGAAPVVFGIMTRARDERFNERVDDDGPGAPRA